MDEQQVNARIGAALAPLLERIAMLEQNVNTLHILLRPTAQPPYLVPGTNVPT